MKVSYQWLQEYFETLPSPEELAEELTFHAFEIEGITRVGDDTVIDVDVLPNRAHDALSHRGIAREISTILAIPLSKDPLTDTTLFPESNIMSVSVEDAVLCPRYQTLVIKNVEVKESPEWLKARLEAIGQRSINTVVDATNYVMFDMGQPLHAFDLDVVGPSLTVRRARNGEQIEALDGEVYALTNDMLVIANDDTALGIAGIKGGMHSGVSQKTTTIVLEAASFNPTVTRKTAQALKLRTDASTRFENDPSPELTTFALREVAKVITTICGGDVEGWTDAYPQKVSVPSVIVPKAQLVAVLGIELSSEDVALIFSRLGFVFKDTGNEYIVTPPFERRDISISEEVIEEIGRVYGYKKIAGHFLPSSTTKVSVTPSYFFSEKIRDVLIQHGFSEVYTPTFVEHGGSTAVLNPLASDKSFLRKTLEGGMLSALEKNKHNAPLLGLDTITLFEIGTVFDEKEEHISLAMGLASDSIKKTDEKVGAVLDALEKEIEGVLGKKLVKEASQHECIRVYDLSKTMSGLVPEDSYAKVVPSQVFEYKPFSAYPFALRDIAFWVPEDASLIDAEKVLRESGGELLKNVVCFDTFKKDGRVSYAFRLVFQSHEKTLSEDDIAVSMAAIVKAVTAHSWVVR